MIERLDWRGKLTDGEALAEGLAQAGLSPEAARAKAALFGKATAALAGLGRAGRASRPTALFVPGRIEVLGKHTDYAGGRSLVVAADRGFCLVVAPRDDRTMTVADAVCGETIAFDIDADLTPRVGHWSNYPMTVARRIARNFADARRGADVALASDLPSAAGMSSSSAMIVAMFLALAEVNRLAEHPRYRRNVQCRTDLAGYLGTVENGQTFGSLEGDRGVGTFGGSEDHTAILCARPGHASQYAYCPVRFERTIPIPADYAFAIGTSGVVAEKTGAAMAKYNAASRLASALAELWRRRTGRDDPHLADVLASGPDAARRLRQWVEAEGADLANPEALLARLEHFVTESQEILPAAGDALARGDLAGFGELVDRSQRGAERLLGNQIAQTAFLAASARAAGAAAASAFGAGFGGGVWALVERSATSPFLDAWAASYRSEFPENAAAAQFFTAEAGPAAFQVV